MTKIGQIDLSKKMELPKPKTVTKSASEGNNPLPLVDKSQVTGEPLTDAQRFLMDPLHFDKEDVEFTREELEAANALNPKVACKFFKEFFVESDERVNNFTQLATLTNNKERLGLVDMQTFAGQDGNKENISLNDIKMTDKYLKDNGNAGLPESWVDQCDCINPLYEIKTDNEGIISDTFSRRGNYFTEIKRLSDGMLLSQRNELNNSGLKLIENRNYENMTGSKQYMDPKSLKTNMRIEFKLNGSGESFENSIYRIGENGGETKFEEVNFKDHPEIIGLYKDKDDYYYYNENELIDKQISKFNKCNLQNGKTMLYLNLRFVLSKDGFEVIFGSKIARENYLKAYIDKKGQLMPGSPYTKH